MKLALPSRRGEIARYVAAILVTLVGLVTWTDFLPRVDSPTVIAIALIANVVATCGALVAMRWRRNHPVVIAVILTLATVPLPGVWAVASWAYLSMCTHRRWRATTVVGLLVIAMNTVGPAFSSGTVNVEPSGAGDGELGVWLHYAAYLVVATMFTVALAAIGSYLGARRDARAAIEQRLASAERERALAEENSRVEERNRIAREMHDVLAHKMSLISMHAGALTYRDDPTRDEVRHAAQTIEDSSHQALNELRVILGGSASRFDVVAEGTDGLQAVDLVGEHRPDLVLKDIRMPGKDGIAATREVLALAEPPVVVMLTTFNTDDLVIEARAPARTASC